MRECVVFFAALALAAPAQAAEALQEHGLGENKRQGLIPFPRVGRSENSEPRMMPAAWLLAPDYYSGKRGDVMRFPSAGPRLGRENKGQDDWALFSLREYPAMNRPQRGRDSSSFTPRLGRELEADEEVLQRPDDGAGAAVGGVRL